MSTVGDSSASADKWDIFNREGPLPRTVEHILESADEVFRRLGYAHATVSDIAKTAQSTRATVYSYFSSKEDIFRRLAERVRDEFAEAQRLPNHWPADQIIRLSDLAYLRAYARNLSLLTILQHQSLSDPHMADLWEEIHGQINFKHRRFIQYLVDGGQAKPVASLEAIASAVNGIVMRFGQLVASEPDLFDKLGDDLVRIHIAMLGLSAGTEDNRRLAE